MRKSLFFAVFTIILSMAGLAQNGKISYQAVVRNGANQLVYDQDLDVTVGIANSETGTAVYTETHAVHSNANGLISLLIGNGTPVAGSNWDAIQWNHAWVTAVVSQGGTELATHHLPLSAVPYALYADQVDPVALANYLTANHYLTEEVQVLSISNDTIYLTGGSWVKLPVGFSGDYNDLTNKPTNVSTFNNDAGYLTKDSAVITNLQGDVTTLNTNVAQLQEATRKDALCDSVEACVKGWISDSTRMVYDSLHTYYATTDALKDSLTRYVSKEKLNDTLGHYLQADDLCDSIVKCDVIRNLRDSVQNNTENITNNTTNITNITNNITNYVTNLQGADSVLAERLAADSTNLADNYYNKTDIDDTLSHYLQAGDLCDSIVKCDVIQNMRDSIRTNASDITSLQNADAALSARITADSTNLAGNYYNKTSIKDTLSHYLMHEEQMLSIGHDTIYLSGGSFVKLPAGFGGSYHDLVDTPTNVSAFTNDAGYLTSFTEQQMLSISNDTIYLTGGSFVKLPAGFSGNYNDLTNKPDLGQYATNEHLNDTLNNYYTQEQIRDTLNNYYTQTQIKDTLSHYLQAGDLCDSIVKCDVVRTMRDSIQINASNITDNIAALLNADSILAARILSDSVLFHQADSILMTRILNDSILTHNTDSILAVRILNDSILSHQADSVLFARIIADSTNLADYYYTNTQINDTLSHYLQAGDLCDSIVKCDVIQNMRDSIRTNASDITSLQNADAALSARITADSTNLAGNYYNKTSIKDTLSHYLMHEEQMLSIGHDTIYLSGGSFVKLPAGFGGSYHDLVDTPTNVSAFTNDAGYLTSFTEQQMLSISNDTIYLTGGSFVKLPAGFSGNYNDLTNKPDLGQYATNEHLNDTLNNYYTQEQIRDTLNNYYTQTQIKDTLSHYLQAGDLCDSIVKCDIVRTLRDSIQIMFDSIGSMHDSIFVNTTNITNNTENITTITNNVNNITTDIHALDSVISARIIRDSTELSNRMDTLLTHVCDSVEACVKGWISDSTRMIVDSLGAYYDTTAVRTVIHDSLGNYLTINGLCDSVKKCDVIKDMQTDITKLQTADNNLSTRIQNDSTNLKDHYYTKTQVDSATNKVRNDICDSATHCMERALANPNSAINNAVDSIAENIAGHAIHDTLVHNVQLTNQGDSLFLRRGGIVDTVKFPAAEMIHDSLGKYVLKTAVRDSITNNVNLTVKNDSLFLTHGNGIDTVPAGKMIKDSIESRVHDGKLAVITHGATKLDTIQKFTANQAGNDTLDLSRYALMDTLHDYYATKAALAESVQKIDSLAGVTMRDSANLKDHYYTQDEIDTKLHDTTKYALRTALRDTALNIRNDICDSATHCMERALANPNSSINNAVDTIAANIAGHAIHDTLVHNVQLTNQGDSLFLRRGGIVDTVKFPAAEMIHDSLGKYVLKTAVRDSITNNVNLTVKNDSLFLTHGNGIDTVPAGKMIKDSIESRVHDGKLAVITHGATKLDTIQKFTANQAGNDTLDLSRYALMDTLHDYYATKTALAESVHKIDSLAGVTSRDSVRLKNHYYTKDEIDTKLHDTTKYALRTALRDTALNIRNDICDSATHCMERALANPNSDINHAIDTIALNSVKDTLDKYVLKTAVRDSITNNVNLTVKNDSLFLTHGNDVDTVPAGKMIKDSIESRVHDGKLAVITHGATKLDTIQKFTANQAGNDTLDLSRYALMDTLHDYYATKTALRDSMHKVDTRIKTDSLEVRGLYIEAAKTLDSLAHVTYRDSIKLKTNYYTRNQVDSTADAVRGEIGKGKLTIQYGTNPAVEFGANQDTTTTVTIPTPPEPAYGTLTIKKNNEPVGTFTANETKEININVPTCDSLAECDLIKSILARLDRLERQNDSLARELDKMKPLLTLAGPQKDTVCSGSTKSVTYTATFHNCSSSDYTLAWKVNGTDSSNVTGSELILNVETAGQYKVVCIATRSDSTFVTDTVTTTVTVDNDVPSFTIAIEGLKVTLSDVVNTATIQWDTDSLPESFTSNTHTYSVADTISITATSERGCTFTKDTVLQPIAPAVTTDSVPSSTIAATTAKVYGTVTSDGGIPETKRGILYSTSDQNLEFGANGIDSVMNGTGKGNYACTLERLVPCTQYYVRAFAYNEVETVYGAILNFTTPSFTCGSTLYDIDGNDYATLLLGSQCWMKQNLRTSRYADGDTIQLSTAIDGSSPARYMPTPADSLKAYGYLYNWAAAARDYSSAANPSTVQGACPAGWHLPSDAEWTQLTAYIASDAANVCDNNPEYIIKSMVSGSEWCPTTQPECFICYNPSSNNHSEFSVRAAGTWNNGTGDFGPTTGYTDLGHTIFTTSTAYENPNTAAWARELYTEHRYVDRTAIYKTIGLSVRCVLDKCDLDNTTYAPTLSPVRFTDTVGTTVTMAASVISDGGANVTERGVCWGTSPHPTVSGDAAATSEGIGDFIVTGNLTAGDTYYVRAYAINDVDTAYGAEVIFVMPMTTKLPPTVNTGSKFLALSEGFEDSTLPSTWTIIDVDGDGNNWYRESMKAKTGNGHAASASAIQTPQDDLIPLSPDNYLITPDITIPDSSAILTFWYSGFYYRSQEHFLVKVGNAGASSVGDFNTQVFEGTTSAEYKQANIDLRSYAGQTIRLAFIHNNTYDKYQLCIDDIVVGEAGAGATIVSDITGNSAVCGGYVSNDGGATVTARGVCWSTYENPTVDSSHTTDGSGTGSFTSEITGLNALTTYYVRAYAINSADTSYGSQVSFKTTEALPEVTTSAVSNITATTATCGGNVTDQGVSAVTARGVCWSTSQNPTISDSHTTDGSDLGSFTSNITGLTADATYYVRAYATNSAGTAYGNQVSFTLPVVDAKSCPEAPIVTDHEGNIYATVQIGTLCWMRENLRTTTSPKTGTYLVNKSGKCSTYPVFNYTYTFKGSKVAHWPYDDSTTYVPKGYGLLYNWCAAMDTANPTNYKEVYTQSTGGNDNYFDFIHSEPHRGICPVGWHVPSNQDWDTLTSVFRQAGKLADGNDWTSSDSATAPGSIGYADRNVSGFTALPAGKFGSCNSDRVNTYAYFWGSTQMYDEHNNPSIAKCMYMYYNNNEPTISADEVDQGMPVRCVRNAESGGETSLSEPEVSTGTVSAVTTTSATVGGEVTSDGGASVIGRGVCWNTLHNPTISDSHTTDGNGTGSFTSSLTGLIPGTIYYVRAYATNSEGTAYGSEMSFTTFSGKRILLDTIQHDYVAKNGDTLVNTLSSPHKISIAAGATITLRNATIEGTNDEAYSWAGINCEEGNATIILEETNIVKGFYEDYPGIYVAPNRTLTIQGTGSLDASSNGWGAGLGGGAGKNCGNIVIEGGNVNATGGTCAAGIGSGFNSSCGDISISNGTVVAKGAQGDPYPNTNWHVGAGIGTGLNIQNNVSCGNITISGGNVTAMGGQGESSNEYFGAGIGTGYSYAASNACGNIIITGGTITANGAHSSAGIGNGYTGGYVGDNYASSSCGYINISGGTVTAKGGWDATGIGNGRTSTSGSCSCGYITIENTVTKVTAISGGSGAVSIGKHSHFNVGTCGTVTIGGVVYSSGVSQSPYVYPQP